MWAAGGEGRPDTFEVALAAGERRLVRSVMRVGGAEKRFDRTITGMTGGALGPAKIEALKDRALGAATWDDVRAMEGVREGPPVNLSRRQKAVTDRLMNGLGSDSLAREARARYEEAIRAGTIKIR